MSSSSNFVTSTASSVNPNVKPINKKFIPDILSFQKHKQTLSELQIKLRTHSVVELGIDNKIGNIIKRNNRLRSKSKLEEDFKIAFNNKLHYKKISQIKQSKFSKNNLPLINPLHKIRIKQEEIKQKNMENLMYMIRINNINPTPIYGLGNINELLKNMRNNNNSNFNNNPKNNSSNMLNCSNYIEPNRIKNSRSRNQVVSFNKVANAYTCM